MTETLGSFVTRFATDVGCFYQKNKGNNYSLKKYASKRRGEMGVFGWVEERTRIDSFVISTYKRLADAQAITEADKAKPGAHFIPTAEDSGGAGTGLFFYVRQNSTGGDYQKAIRSLRVVRKNR